MRSPSPECHDGCSFQSNLLRLKRLKEPQTATQEHGHHVDVQLVNNADVEGLLSGPGAAYDSDIFGASGRLWLVPLSRPRSVQNKVNDN